MGCARCIRSSWQSPLSLHRAGVVEDFVVADKILCKVGAIEGVSVTDPASGIL
jgi:hypothetical protein